MAFVRAALVTVGAALFWCVQRDNDVFAVEGSRW
jgi:hypothetical protein